MTTPTYLAPTPTRHASLLTGGPLGIQLRLKRIDLRAEVVRGTEERGADAAQPFTPIEVSTAELVVAHAQNSTCLSGEQHLGIAVELSELISTLAYLVLHVLTWSTNKQVIRAYARRIVTAVAGIKAFSNSDAAGPQCEMASLPAATVPFPNGIDPVFPARYAPHPDPASRVRLWDAVVLDDLPDRGH